ncbi:hypothetical protein D1007_36964 [Hordeum vulgare]|nr:hypothetical protein D1007_36964 [Hordeum vulgare]
MVAELIDHTSARWNRELITSTFLPIDADVILNIPLRTRHYEDYWSWSQDKKGLFSVKSCYRMLITTKLRREAWLEGNGGPADVTRERKCWDELWRIQVPSKINISLWRLSQTSLPTADIRHHRNMAPSRACAICGAEDSWIHSLLTCTMARCVWVLHNSELVEHMLANAEPDAKSWLFSMRSSVSATEMTKITVTLWAIWFARRKLIHEGEHQNPGATLAFVNRYIAELELNKPASRSTPTPVHSNTRRWIKPPAGWTKINIDGAVCKAPSIGAISAVCRDEQGAYLGSSAVVFHGLTDPLILETLARRQAQALGRELLLQKVAVASDCLNAIQEINSGSEGITGPIIKEISDGRSDFQHILFTHEGRLSNMEAHHLARYALHLWEGRHVWLLEPFDTTIIPVIRNSDQ